MHVNPLLIYAPNSAKVLDAAAHVLDRNIVIKESDHFELEDVASEFNGNVLKMCNAALKMIPTKCDDYVRVILEDEIKSLSIVARTSNQVFNIKNKKVVAALGASGFAAQYSSDVMLFHDTRIEGLVSEGHSMLGVSCPFVIQNSGTAGTRGFWIDNYTGLPVANWLRHRSEVLDYVAEFSGGPWSGKRFSDSKLLNINVKYSSIFCDYEAYKFGVGDSKNGMCFRFRWNDTMHSSDLLAEGNSVSYVQRRIKKYAA